jgi:Domain of unknown function DUF1829/Domain of unknown function DUF1828
MIEEIRTLLDSYALWLRDKTALRSVDEWIEITAPYLDRHNDFVQIYAKRTEGGYLLTDDGRTIQDLEQGGTRLNSPKRRDLLRLAVNGFGVHLDNDRLEVRASPETFGQRKHNLIQAMLSVNDMFYLAQPLIASLFYEDVVAWLDLSEIRYSPRVKFTGKTGYDHLFDFVIPKSKVAPERILETINRPSRDTAEALAFKWVDTKEVRASDTRAYALLNDAEQEVPAAVLDALASYEVRPVPWSHRDRLQSELLA